MMFRRALASALLLVAGCTGLCANEFDWIVRDFARQSGAKQVHVPFIGLARFVVAVGHPAGTSDFRLAIFERGALETPRFSNLIDAAAGGFWKPMIRVRSAKGEVTNIYLREEGHHLNLLIASLDGDQATFVEVRIKPEELVRFVDEHGRSRGNGPDRR